MHLTRLIVHHVDKDFGRLGANTHPSIGLVPVDETSTQLVQALDESYARRNINYAVFNDAPVEAFRDGFERYSRTPTDEEFIAFSGAAANSLCEGIAGVLLAKGGYLAFAEYALAIQSYCAVYLVRNTQGMIFVRDEAHKRFVINPALHLDFDKLAMACRIDRNKHGAGSGHYLELITTRGDDVADYFTRWVAAVHKATSRSETETLIALAAELPPPEKDGKQVSRDEFQQRVHDYVMDRPGLVVNTRALSEHFYGDTAVIPEFAARHGIALDTEFRADPVLLPRLIRIEVQADGILLRTTRDKLDTVIRLDQNNPNAVVIESHAFRSKLERARNDAFGRAP